MRTLNPNKRTKKWVVTFIIIIQNAAYLISSL